MGRPGKMSPALQSFDSANVHVIDELQACLLLGWENHPLTCGSEAGDIHGQGNPLDSTSVGFEDSCKSFNLEVKRTAHTYRGQSPHPQHGLSLPVGPTKESYQYQVLILCMGRGCSSQFHSQGSYVLGGNTVARLVRVPLAGYP